MYKLSLETVQRCAVEYYNKKLLTAQHPDPECRLCQNSVGEYRCAVAACYPDDVIKEFQGTVETGVYLKVLEVPDDPVDWAKIVRIQMAHDLWADAYKNYPNNPIVGRLEQLFCGLVGIHYLAVPA